MINVGAVTGVVYGNGDGGNGAVMVYYHSQL